MNEKLTKEQVAITLNALCACAEKTSTIKMVAKRAAVPEVEAKKVLAALSNLPFIYLHYSESGRIKGIGWKVAAAGSCSVRVLKNSYEYYHEEMMLGTAGSISPQNSILRSQLEYLAEKHNLPMFRTYQSTKDRIEETMKVLYASYLASELKAQLGVNDADK